MYNSQKGALYNYWLVVEMPGVARDSIRNEGTREMRYGIIQK
jgi:hypothetical protein